jgi:hypothetical protein
MHCGTISFCGKTALNIKDNDVKKDILDDIYNITGIKIIQKHYILLNQNILKIIHQGKYLMTLRTNGNPYLLFFTQINFVNQCIFIDKKIQKGYYQPRMIVSRFEFDDELFNNTLIDGEMIKNNNGNEPWTFLINDIYMYNNKNVLGSSFFKRMTILIDILNNHWRFDKNNLCFFQIKKYFQLNEIEYVVNNFIPNLNYTCRGLYFKHTDTNMHTQNVPKKRDVLYNFDEELIIKVNKNKLQTNGLFMESVNEKVPVETTKIEIEIKNQDKVIENEKDFYVMKTNMPDVYILYETNEKDSKEIDNACINTLSTSKYMKEKFKNINILEKIIIRCSYNELFQKWVPVVSANCTRNILL